TESTNTVFFAAVHDLGCTRIITSPIEHHATLHTAEYLEKKGWVKVEYVNLLPNGHVDLADLESRLHSGIEKTLVSLMHANNEISKISDMHDVLNINMKYEEYYYFYTIQTVVHFPFEL